MFRRLDNAKTLTINQMKIIAAAIVGDMLEFFDYYLIAFVLAFIIKPWHLTFGESAIILTSSGFGAILGAFIWGRIADLIGRRKVFIGTVPRSGRPSCAQPAWVRPTVLGGSARSSAPSAWR